MISSAPCRDSPSSPSAAARACIGQGFAMTEAMLVLATLCRRFFFAPDPTYRLELRPTLTLRPRENIRLILRRRKFGSR